MIISLAGCEYHTDKEFVNDVKQPDNANLTIVLNPSDSVYYLGKSNTFVCDGFSNEVKVYNIKVYLDHSLVEDMDGPRCVFSLYGSNYTEGHHVLTIAATTSAGSGSLADILNSEGFLFTYEWDLVVDRSPPAGAVQITNIFNDNGVLRIEWEKYNNPNFKYYHLIKTVFNNTGSSYNMELPVVSDRNQNYFQDDSYLGGKVQYEIQVVTPFNETVTGPPEIFIDDEITLNVEWIGEDLLKFSWPELKYPKAFKSFTIYMDDKQLYYSSNIDTATVTLHAGAIGKKSDFVFRIESIFPPYYGNKPNYYYSISDFSFGLRMIEYNSLFKNNINKSVYLSTNQKLYRFDTETRKLMDSVEINEYDYFVLSPDNKILISGNSNKKYNPDNLNDHEDVEVLCSKLGSISNNSLGIAYDQNNNVLYDFLNLEIISAFPAQVFEPDIFITEDSKYFLQGQNGNQKLGCYKIENGLWTENWNLPMNSYALIPGEPDKVMLLFNNACEIRSVETSQVIKKFEVNASEITGVDPTTKTVLLRMPDPFEESKIYNYQTGEMLRDIKTTRDRVLTYYRSAIYSSNGTVVPFNF